MALNERIIQAESGGRTHVKNPRSSAYGPGQFINSTWLNLVNRYRPDLAQGRSTADILALRTDSKLSGEMVDNYSRENAEALRAHGFEPTDENLYLAHFAGPAGAASLLANPDKPAASILSPSAIEANPFLKDWSARAVVDWASGKVSEKPRTLSPTTPSSDAVGMQRASAQQPSAENSAVLPFLASLFGGGGGAAAGAAGGLDLAGLLKGGDLAGLFGGEGGANGGGLLNGLFSGGAGGPASSSPAGGAMAASGMQAGGGLGNMMAGMGGGMEPPAITTTPNPTMGPMTPKPVDMSGLQRLMAMRPQLGSNVGMLR